MSLRDLGQRDRQHLQRRMKGDQRLVAGQSPQTGCRPAPAAGRAARQQGRHPRPEASGCVFSPVPTAVPPMARRCTATSAWRRLLVAQRELGRVAAELLAQRHRRRIHQVRAAGLDDAGERQRLGFQRHAQLLQRRQQAEARTQCATARCIAVGRHRSTTARG
jgi:hypothetical protein